jgi:hypothetical protein
MVFYLDSGPLLQFALEAFYDFILSIFKTLPPTINALLNYYITQILFQDLYLNYCMIIEYVLVFGIGFCKPGKSLLSYKHYLHAITY